VLGADLVRVANNNNNNNNNNNDINNNNMYKYPRLTTSSIKYEFN